jgi:hypothetical protein
VTAADRRRAAILLAIALALGCAATAVGDGLDPAQLPVDTRDDYAVFARRCSKCHSLARALYSAIDRDSLWEAYVDRMRRQPGSGIAPRDVAPILRFLHYYTLHRPRRDGAGDDGPLLSERE